MRTLSAAETSVEGSEVEAPGHVVARCVVTWLYKLCVLYSTERHVVVDDFFWRDAIA